MKLSFKILFIALLGITLIGCAAQKKVVVAAESEILHQQALKALEDRRFIIKVSEFHQPNGNKLAVNSYISMQGNRGMIKFSPDLTTGYFVNLTSDNITDDMAEIKMEKNKQNGDVQFSMKIFGEESWKKNKVSITLYNNSNQCFVRVQNEYNAEIVDFVGSVYPNNK